MATIFFSANDLAINNVGLNGSGLGFYGPTFGTSVNVASYQDSTWITDSNGLSQGPQVNNIKYTHPASGSINGLTSKNVLDIPNYLATLKISFTHTSPVTTQNARFRCYDRSNINNNPSGVACMAYDVRHPSTVQTGSLGSGSASWTNIFGSGSILSMVDSPGVSGLRPNGASTSSNQHDWYLALSQSPSSVGSKLTAGYFSVEYL
jgi:hypothetical protein